MIDLRRLRTPVDIVWRINPKFPSLQEACLNGQMAAWIEPRPAYCDRGHWKMHVELPDIDGQDGFPRYYMCLAAAKSETEAFLKWRLWKIRAREESA